MRIVLDSPATPSLPISRSRAAPSSHQSPNIKNRNRTTEYQAWRQPPGEFIGLIDFEFARDGTGLPNLDDTLHRDDGKIHASRVVALRRGEDESMAPFARFEFGPAESPRLMSNDLVGENVIRLTYVPA